MRLEIKFNHSYPILHHRYRQFIPRNSRFSEKKREPRKHSKLQIWGQKPRIGTTGQIILKIPKR